MRTEDDLRSQLQDLADRAPIGGDLAAIRELGGRRRRARQTAIAAVAALGILTVGAAGALLWQTGDDTSTIEAAGPATDATAPPEPETTTAGQPVQTSTTSPPNAEQTSTTRRSDRNRSTLPPTTIPTDPTGDEGGSPDSTETSLGTSTSLLTSTRVPDTTEPPPTSFGTTIPGGEGAPTPEAIAADEEFRRVPVGYLDCGSIWTTAGFPTTTAPHPDLTDCIAAAFVRGEASHYSYSARNFSGGSAGAIYLVYPGGDAELVTFTVDPEGRVSSQRTPCERIEQATKAPFWKPTCT